VLCPISLRLCLLVTTSILLMRGSSNIKITSANSPPSLTALALIIIACNRVLRWVPSATPPLWQSMPTGERDEGGDFTIKGSSRMRMWTFRHFHVHVYYAYVLCIFVLIMNKCYLFAFELCTMLLTSHGSISLKYLVNG
jgi:hypothetical protein